MLLLELFLENISRLDTRTGARPKPQTRSGIQTFDS